ncbi:MAG: hypothetical protein ACPG4M_08300 [Alphaproteobacteria bacterium]|jgi:hypothetical protein
MGQRGRKSSGDVLVAETVQLVARPDAPLDLTPEQQEEWSEIVSALPADWFSRENYPLLAQYVRHVVDARRIAQLIDQEVARQDMDIATYAELLKAQRQESTALKTLAASMRLAQQAKYNALSASTAAKKSNSVPAPWRQK